MTLDLDLQVSYWITVWIDTDVNQIVNACLYHWTNYGVRRSPGISYEVTNQTRRIVPSF